VNLRFVINQLGLLLVVLGLVMLAIAVGDLFYLAAEKSHEISAILALSGAAGVGIVLGGGVWIRTRGSGRSLGRREALLLVSLSWFVGAFVSSLPYLIWAHIDSHAPPDHEFRSPVNCYFEAMSGLTTTGATVLSKVATLPASLLLWRAFTHWLGGLGIVLLFVAVLPSIGVGGKKLYRVEAPGPTPEGVHPHIRETARILWLIYLTLTIAQIVALRVFGMDWFDSICHTFGTLATGGFSPRNASVGEFHSQGIDYVIVFFMILAGGNFGLYHLLIVGKLKNVWRDPELRLYLILMSIGSIFVIVSILGQTIVMTDGTVVEPSVSEAVRHGVFTTVAIKTTTGFCTADFNQWPFAAKGVLILLMFVGGCAGSTAGGIKVIRVWIAFKVMISELERIFRPNVIRPIKIGNTPIDQDLKLGTLAYIFGFILIFVIGAGAIMLIESNDRCTFTTAATASIATLCTIGPGLDGVGAVENYGWFKASSKVVMILLMAMGRLEVFAVIVLFSPRFWKGT
jgi:trk system potassium uptake protein TrkH